MSKPYYYVQADGKHFNVVMADPGDGKREMFTTVVSRHASKGPAEKKSHKLNMAEQGGK